MEEHTLWAALRVGTRSDPFRLVFCFFLFWGRTRKKLLLVVFYVCDAPPFGGGKGAVFVMPLGHINSSSLNQFASLSRSVLPAAFIESDAPQSSLLLFTPPCLLACLLPCCA